MKKKKGIKATNFWSQKVSYRAKRTAQEFLDPNMKVRVNRANSECFGTCGDDYDSGCASDSDCSGACS